MQGRENVLIGSPFSFQTMKLVVWILISLKAVSAVYIESAVNAKSTGQYLQSTSAGLALKKLSGPISTSDMSLYTIDTPLNSNKFGCTNDTRALVQSTAQETVYEMVDCGNFARSRGLFHFMLSKDGKCYIGQSPDTKFISPLKSQKCRGSKYIIFQIPEFQVTNERMFDEKILVRHHLVDYNVAD